MTTGELGDHPSTSRVVIRSVTYPSSSKRNENCKLPFFTFSSNQSVNRRFFPVPFHAKGLGGPDQAGRGRQAVKGVLRHLEGVR